MTGDSAPRPPTDGLIVVDKPAGMTSHDVVARLRRLAHTRRVGHAGTLDPMATGVLVVGVGRATRLLTHLVLTQKAYRATVRLGAITVTDDADGEIIARQSAAALTEADVRAATMPLTGDIQQRPSAVSAIKVNGQRAYARVRAGEAVDLPARPVTVSRFDVLTLQHRADVLDIDVDVECSAGTYIRALARDLGEALGVGGHLTALRRTRVGPFGLDAALTLDQLAALDDPVILPLAAAVRATMAVRAIDEREAVSLSYGQAIEPAGLEGIYGVIDPAGVVRALLRETDGRACPVLVFVAAG